jgi:hypothetical protein
LRHYYYLAASSEAMAWHNKNWITVGNGKTSDSFLILQCTKTQLKGRVLQNRNIESCGVNHGENVGSIKP